MTREQAQQRAEVMAAWAKGAEAEWESSAGRWNQIDESCAWSSIFDVRIKPTPKLRPWKASEVPAGAIIRDREFSEGWTAIGGARDGGPFGGLWFMGIEKTHRVSFDTAFLGMEHSIDGGKTWLPCGVMEDAQ